MNWDAIGAIGEIIGALAVIATLIYVAIQVRHASAIAKANAYREIHHDVGQLFGDVMSNPELYRIWRSGLVEGQPLNDEDREKLGMILFRLFGALDAGHHSGWLDPGLDGFVRTSLEGFLETPAVQGWWSRRGHLQPKPFRELVEEILAEIKARSAKDAPPPNKAMESDA
ncbi:MAG: hypothetical protein RIC85_04700 [Gammaproteobacteria bacterium]